MAEKRPFLNTTRIVMIALFGALTGLLHIAKFPLSFAFPGFLEFDFSDIPLFIGVFALGPLSGCIIVVVKLLIKLVCVGTANFFVGELANLLIGWAFAIPAGLIYRRHRSVKGAIFSLFVGSLSSVAVAILANWLILIPFYVDLLGGYAPLIGMMKGLFPKITEETFLSYYLWISVLPFNLLRCIVASGLCFVVYKRISRLINRLNERLSPKGGEADKRMGVAAAVFAGVVLLLIVFALLRFFIWKS